jgi:hypothetical protein
MRRKKLFVLGCAALLVVMEARSTTAAPISYSTNSGNVSHALLGVQDSYNTLVYGVDSLGPLTAEASSSVGWSSVTDTALHAYATNNGGVASATATAGFFDTLMITSDSMAEGELAHFLAEIDFSYTLTGAACGALVQGFVSGPTGHGSLGVSDGAGDCSVADYTIYEPFVGVVGQEFAINVYLTAAVAAFTPGTADAANTLQIFLTPLDDFTYTTASGNTYSKEAAAVPEPATVAMCGLGIGLVAFSRRKRIPRG